MPRRSQSPNIRKYEPAPKVPATISHMSVQRPSMLQTMKEGLAFGVGNAVAHRMIMGASLNQQQPQQQQQQQEHEQQNPEYIQCIKEYNEKSVCDTLYLKKNLGASLQHLLNDLILFYSLSFSVFIFFHLIVYIFYFILDVFQN